MSQQNLLISPAQQVHGPAGGFVNRYCWACFLERLLVLVSLSHNEWGHRQVLLGECSLTGPGIMLGPSQTSVPVSSEELRSLLAEA